MKKTGANLIFVDAIIYLSIALPFPLIICIGALIEEAPMSPLALGGGIFVIIIMSIIVAVIVSTIYTNTLQSKLCKAISQETRKLIEELINEQIEEQLDSRKE
jgi:uncharacterized membrane protein (DUF106 family)